MSQSRNPDNVNEPRQAVANRRQKDKMRYRKLLASMSPSELREYRRNKSVISKRSYRRRKDEISEQARNDRDARRQFLSKDELQRCISDPRLAFTIRGDEVTPCLICGELVQLISAHLQGRHPDVTLRMYAEKFGFNYSTGLASKALIANARGRANHNDIESRARLERARSAPGAGQTKTKRRMSTVARLNQSERMRGTKSPNRLANSEEYLRKASIENVLNMLARGLPLAESARLLGISTHAFWRRARQLKWDTGKNARIQRRLIAYCSALRTHFRESRSPVTVTEVLGWHADQMRAGVDDLFQEIAVFLPSIRSELESDPAVLQRLTQQSSGLASGISGKAVVGLASRILRRIMASREIALTSTPAPSGVGRKRLLVADTAWFKVGRQVESVLPRFALICKDLVRLPRRVRTRLRDLKDLPALKQYNAEELEAATYSTRDPLIASTLR